MKDTLLRKTLRKGTATGATVPPNVPVKTGTRHGGLPAPFINVLRSKTWEGILLFNTQKKRFYPYISLNITQIYSTCQLKKIIYLGIGRALIMKTKNRTIYEVCFFNSAMLTDLFMSPDSLFLFSASRTEKSITPLRFL